MPLHQRRSARRATGTVLLALAVTSVAACAGGDAEPSAATASGANSASDTTAAPTNATLATGVDTGVDPGVDTVGATDGGATTDNPTSEPTDASGNGDDGDGDDRGAATLVTLPHDADLEPVEGGTFRFALIADVDGLNPTSSALTASSGLIMANAVFDTLAAYAADGSVVPYLAESFTPSPDFSSWEVTLRPGVTFHDGTPLDAAAVQLNFESQRANDLIGLAVRPFYPDTNATEVVDDLTVRFNLLNPNRYWPYSMATQLGMVASPAWIEAAHADPTLNQRPIGTGPFVFDSRSEDSVTRFVRNDAWWNGHAYLDALEVLPVPAAATRNDFVLTGVVDGLPTTEPSSIVELREQADVNLALDDSGA
ncbi:MAG TPA: ABC transporter substrate-binding protein, partial [Ilumatobacter sp.]|nr:ABC transporter substrate-binding protein [Ilumatobacter sp.]